MRNVVFWEKKKQTKVKGIIQRLRIANRNIADKLRNAAGEPRVLSNLKI